MEHDYEGMRITTISDRAYFVAPLAPAKYLDCSGKPIKDSKGVQCPPGNSFLFFLEEEYWKAVYEGREQEIREKDWPNWIQSWKYFEDRYK